MESKPKTRREFLKFFGSTAALFFTTPILSCTKNIPPKPNIVIILGDDIGFSDIGCYGSEINTPNLAKLAEKGIHFSHFYNMAKCTPTRSSLLTGVYKGNQRTI